eukprot:5190269-Pleurochrysis_carterae.AAC.1
MDTIKVPNLNWRPRWRVLPSPLYLNYTWDSNTSNKINRREGMRGRRWASRAGVRGRVDGVGARGTETRNAA